MCLGVWPINWFLSEVDLPFEMHRRFYQKWSDSIYNGFGKLSTNKKDVNFLQKKWSDSLSGLSSSPLLYLPILLPIYIVSITLVLKLSLEVKRLSLSTLFSFFKIALSIWGALHLSVHFRIKSWDTFCQYLHDLGITASLIGQGVRRIKYVPGRSNPPWTKQDHWVTL